MLYLVKIFGGQNFRKQARFLALQSAEILSDEVDPPRHLTPVIIRQCTVTLRILPIISRHFRHFPSMPAGEITGLDGKQQGTFAGFNDAVFKYFYP